MGIFGAIFGGEVASGGSPPTVTIVSPSVDTDAGDPGGFSADPATAQQTPIVIDIEDATYACISCRYPGAADEIMVFVGLLVDYADNFTGTFAARSWAEIVGSALRLHILPDGGWRDTPALADIVFEIDAVGTDGSVTTSRPL